MRRLRATSLHTRLLLVGMVGIVLFSLVASWLLGRLFEQFARNAVDRRLQNDLIALVARSHWANDGSLDLGTDPDRARYGKIFSGAYWQVFDVSGRALAQSHSLWDGGLTPPPGVGDGAVHAYDLHGPMQQNLRSVARQVRLPRGEPLVFVVAEDGSAIGFDAASFSRQSAITVGVLASLWFAVLVYQVRYGLRPLRQLEQTAVRVRTGEDARFPDTGLLKEVAPLAGHLNELLDHHARMSARARSSAEDLAHALKTPLAVLSTLPDGDDLRWQETIREQVARMQFSVERHLAMGVTVDSRQRTEVAPVVTALLQVMQRVHGERGLRFIQQCDASKFAGSVQDLEEMLGNLLDNACRWAREQVTVSAALEEGRLIVQVLDDGPGLSAEQRKRVLARGVRLDERRSGSGLGLPIVGDLAASYGGSLSLFNAGPGLGVRLELPGAS